MPTRLLLISDTHVPARARRLPDQVLRAVDEADLVVHAGDWVDVATLDALEARAARLVGVYGKNVGAALRARLPEVARFGLEGMRFGVVHETGAASGREARMDAAYAGRADDAGDAGAGDAGASDEGDRRGRAELDVLVVDGRRIKVLAERDPADLPWK